MLIARAEILLMMMPLAAVGAIVLARQQSRIAVLQRELRQARHGLLELESLFEQAPLGLAVFDAEGRFVRVNRLLAQTDGLAADDHPGRTVRDVAPGVADVAEAAFRQVMRTGHPVSGLEFNGATDASPEARRDWRLGMYPVCGPAGVVLGVAAALEDITERHSLDAALRDSEQRERRRAAELDSVMETAPVAIFIAHDRHCHHVTANATARRLLRLAPGESPLRAFDVYVDNSFVHADHLPLQRAAATGEETWRRALVNRFVDGAHMRIVMNAVPLRDDHGRVCGAVAAFIEVADGRDAHG